VPFPFVYLEIDMSRFVRPLLCVLALSSLAASVFAAGGNAATREGRAAAERIERNGERDANRGNDRGAREAKEAAREARAATTPERVREIERSYNVGGDSRR
jgi:hypothetical protein